MFVVAPECRRLTGVDPQAPDVVETHADAVIAPHLRTLIPMSGSSTGRHTTSFAHDADPSRRVTRRIERIRTNRTRIVKGHRP